MNNTSILQDKALGDDLANQEPALPPISPGVRRADPHVYSYRSPEASIVQRRAQAGTIIRNFPEQSLIC